MRGELGAVELTLCDRGGVSVRSLMERMAKGRPWREASGGRAASCWSGSDEPVGEVERGDTAASDLCMTSLARADCLA